MSDGGGDRERLRRPRRDASAPSLPDIRMSRPIDLPGVRLLQIAPSALPFQAFQETWDVCLVSAGASDWRYRGGTRTSVAGNVRLKEPGERFRTERVHAPVGYVIVQLEPAALVKYLDRAGPHLRANEIEGPEATAIAHMVRRAHHCETALERGAMLAALVEAAVVPRLETRADRKDPKPPRAIRKAHEFLHAHFDEEIPLSTLAGLADMHEVSFVRAFRRAFGIPPHRLQTELRVRSAKRLLDRGATGAEVAALVGFHDQSHLTRHFKSIVGLSPGRYLASRR